jgi:hypothetical protein
MVQNAYTYFLILKITKTVSYFEIVFSVLTGFSVNLSANLQAEKLFGNKGDAHQSKGNKSTEVFGYACEDRDGHNMYLRGSQNSGMKNQIEKKLTNLGTR